MISKPVSGTSSPTARVPFLHFHSLDYQHSLSFLLSVGFMWEFRGTLTSFAWDSCFQNMSSMRCLRRWDDNVRRLATSISSPLRAIHTKPIPGHSMSGVVATELPQQNVRPMTERNISAGPFAVARFLVGLFSDFERRRDPPSETKNQHARLITIRGSHYCEKGRWTMDLVEADQTSPVYYTEDPHPLGFHAFATVAATKNSGSITPCLLLDPISTTAGPSENSPEIISDTAQLMRKFLPSLYPHDIKHEVEAFEDFLGERLGPTLRVFAYNLLLEPKYHNVVVTLMTNDTTKVEKFLFNKMIGNGISAAVRKVMKINDTTAELSRAVMFEVFDLVSNKLKEGTGEYIMDTKEKRYGFTAADLTFAALASPFVPVPERAEFNFDEEVIPDKLRSVMKELLGTLAGQHVLRMYSKHRLTEKGQTLASIKGVDRNKWPLTFW
jgi:glutathione S-transferase